MEQTIFSCISFCHFKISDCSCFLCFMKNINEAVCSFLFPDTRQGISLRANIIDLKYIMVEYNTIFNAIWQWESYNVVQTMDSLKDTPYLTLTGELWGTFSKFFQ